MAEAEKAFEGMVVKGLYAKLALILETMPNDMRPQGNNSHFHYDYWTLDQISGYFRNRFGELGIAFMADVETFDIREHETSKGGKSFLTTLLVLFTLTDHETGQTVSGHGIGQGDDPGDKGANKAFSGALKYWLLKAFVVGGDDAEADERTDQRSERRARRAQEDDRPVRIGDSSIEGIARGGRSNKTSTVQIRQIRELAKDLNWNATGAARRISEWVGDEIELPEDVETHGEALVSYLEALNADDAGTVITKMLELRDEQRDEDKNDDDRYDGRSDP